MADMILATPVLSDAATITAGLESAAGPATNLQKMQPTDVWESATTTPYIEIDLGSITDFNLVAMLFTSGESGAIWRVRTADTQGNLTAAPDYDSGLTAMTNISPDGHIFDWYSTPKTNRWVRIDFLFVTDPFTAGRLYIANAFQPTLNYRYGAADGYDDDSIIDVTDGGNLIPTHGKNRAVLDLTMNVYTETDRHAIRELNRTRGASRDVLLIRDPEAATNLGDYSYYGLLQRRRQAIQTSFNLHEINYQLTTF